MSGLAKADDYTFSATLTKRAGYFMTELGLWPFWWLISKVIASAGENVWTTKPETLIGSGPFRLAARVPGQSMDFQPVPSWYGGTTGKLTRVHVDVVAEAGAQVTPVRVPRFQPHRIRAPGPPPRRGHRYTSDAKLKSQLDLSRSASPSGLGSTSRPVRSPTSRAQGGTPRLQRRDRPQRPGRSTLQPENRLCRRDGRV